MDKKGIYCIEGLWEKDVRDKSTVLPILELLEKRGICNHVYHTSATKEEFEFFLNKWKTKKINSDYPILYLAFHGEIGAICINNKEKYTLEDISQILENSCTGKVLYFGSCSTFNIHKSKINALLKKTDAIAAIGYKSDIDWIKSTACDMFVFEALQNDKLDSKGIKKIHQDIISEYGNLYKTLELNVITNDSKHFPRALKK